MPPAAFGASKTTYLTSAHALSRRSCRRTMEMHCWNLPRPSHSSPSSAIRRRGGARGDGGAYMPVARPQLLPIVAVQRMPSSFSDKSQPVGRDDASPKLCASATDLATSAFSRSAAPPPRGRRRGCRSRRRFVIAARGARASASSPRRPLGVLARPQLFAVSFAVAPRRARARVHAADPLDLVRRVRPAPPAASRRRRAAEVGGGGGWRREPARARCGRSRGRRCEHRRVVVHGPCLRRPSEKACAGAWIWRVQQARRAASSDGPPGGRIRLLGAEAGRRDSNLRRAGTLAGARAHDIDRTASAKMQALIESRSGSVSADADARRSARTHRRERAPVRRNSPPPSELARPHRAQRSGLQLPIAHDDDLVIDRHGNSVVRQHANQNVGLTHTNFTWTRLSARR